MAKQRNPKGALFRALQQSKRPVFLLDARNQLLFGNPIFWNWIELTPEEGLGQPVQFGISGDDFTALSPCALKLNAIAPPPAKSTRPETYLVQKLAVESNATNTDSRAGTKPRFYQCRVCPLGDTVEEVGRLVVVERELDSTEKEVSHLNEVDRDCEVESQSQVELHHEIQQQLNRFRAGFSLQHFVGPSAKTQRLRAQIELASSQLCQVLVTGPNGSGKEHLVRTIHHRRNSTKLNPLAALECTLLDVELLQATIGDLQRELAKTKGSHIHLLLINVEKLIPQAQQYVLEQLKLRSTGNDANRFVLSATTSSSLAALRQNGAVLDELLERLGTIVIEVPPLRERIEDLPHLAQAFLERYASGASLAKRGFTTEAIERLASYHWPGNLDELREFVIEAAKSGSETLIAGKDLPTRVSYSEQAAQGIQLYLEPLNMDDLLKRVELELVQRALKQTRGNKTKAAQLLGMTRMRFHNRCDELGIVANDQESVDGNA